MKSPRARMRSKELWRVLLSREMEMVCDGMTMMRIGVNVVPFMLGLQLMMTRMAPMVYCCLCVGVVVDDNKDGGNGVSLVRRRRIVDWMLMLFQFNMSILL